MRVNVGDVRLFVEVLGRKIDDHLGWQVERPTLVLLHGGPAWDHTTLLSDLAPLADVAQLVFYDHRGLGRSDRSGPEHWNLDRWADDLRGLLAALEIERPIILGQSFGGMVAQRFAIGSPHLCSGLILLATAARIDLAAVVAAFTDVGGPRIGEAARAQFTSGDPALRAVFREEALRYYTQTPGSMKLTAAFRPDVSDWFFSDAGDARRYDYREALKATHVPALIIGGNRDPVFSPAATHELAHAFPPGMAEAHVLERCGHGPARDRPHATLELIRAFVTSVARST